MTASLTREQLGAEIKRLVSEYGDARESCANGGSRAVSLAIEAHDEIDRSIDALVSAEADAKDARRYRWLRDYSNPGICAFYISVGKAFDGVKFARETVDQAIDAQIDATIANEKE